MTFKLGQHAAKPPEKTKLEYPGEIRKAILSGRRFGIYVKRFVEEYQFQLMAKPDGSALPIKAFPANETPFFVCDLKNDPVTGELCVHDTPTNDPDWRIMNQVFRAYWNLLERGCKVRPNTEFYTYE